MLVTKQSGGGGSGLNIKGSIAIASDFPTLALVKTGRVYKITADVTDNDVTKTNTGLSFRNGDIIYWDGSTWLDITGLETWIDNGTTVTPINLRDINANGMDVTNADKITYDITPTSSDALTEGQTRWNATDMTVDLGMGYGVTQQIGQEMPILAYNDTGVQIEEGVPVYISGRQGHVPKIALARSDVEATSHTFGLTTSTFAASGDRYGFVTIVGYVRQIKTNYSGSGNRGTTWAVGDKLYISKTVAGQLTNIEPTAPHHSDIIGEVAVVGSLGTGSIFVNIQTHKTLQELSDINGTALNTTGQLPVRNNTNQYFDFDYKITNDTTLSASSANNIPSENAVKTYVDTLIGGVTSGALTNNLGSRNASTNTPTITSSVGTLGDWYTVSVSGTTTIDGISSWGIGDFIRFDGAYWQKIDNQNPGSSTFFSIVSNTTLSSVHYNGIIKTTGTITITLPTAIGITGRKFTFIKSDDYNYTLTLLTTSNQTINGEIITYINPQYTSFTVVSDGANYFIL